MDLSRIFQWEMVLKFKAASSRPPFNQPVISHWPQTASEQPVAGPNDPEPAAVKRAACRGTVHHQPPPVRDRPLPHPAALLSLAGMCPWIMCNFPLKLEGSEPWKAPQVRAEQRRLRYTPGLRAVKLRWQKDTWPLVCNVLKAGEINYPSALNYEMCLRSWRCFIS